jgi:outer membrane protein
VEEEAMNNRLPRTLLLLAALIAAPATQAANLLEIYQRAQQNDPTWAAAQANYRAGIEKGPQGRSLLLPTVSAAASTYRVNQDATSTNLATGTTLTGDYRYDNNGYGVQLSQPLFRVPNFAAYAQGKIGVSQAEAELTIARQDLILRAAQAYFGVLSAQDTLEFTRTEKNAIKGQLDLAERNFAVGNATVVDVHEARARHDLAAAEEVLADAQLQLAREALAALIGAPVETLAPLSPKLPLPSPEPADVTQWVKAADEQNLQIQVQQYLLGIAEEELRKNRGGHYPTLDLVASHVYNDAGGSAFGIASESTTNQIGLQLQVPIYQGGYVSSRVRETAAREQQAREQLTFTRRQTARLARDAYLAVTAGAVRVRALEQAQVSSRRALESTLIGYESGVRTGVDVLNAQRELYRTARDLSQARYNWLVFRLQLKAVVGTLGDTDVAEANGVLTGE